VKELTSRSDLKDDVDVGGVIEEAVHLDDVRVMQVGLDLELSDKLVDNFLFDQQFLLRAQIHPEHFCISQFLPLEPTTLGRIFPSLAPLYT
jgi:hypothetical protein